MSAKEHVKSLKYKNSGVLYNHDIIELFNKYHFESVYDIKKAGLKIKEIGSGEFRTAYLIEKQLVAKFPTGDIRYCKSNWGHTAIGHSINEVAAIKKVLKTRKFRPMHRYMPEILYFNEETGVILMHRYDSVSSDKSIICGMITDLADDIGLNYCDFHEYNVGINDDGEVKVLDLGLME